MNENLQKSEPRANPATRPAQATAQWLYGIFAFAFALFLFISIPYLTTYFEGVEWYKQPRTWPAIAITGMLIAGAGHFMGLCKFKEENNALPFKSDLKLLLGAFEISFWFVIYVFCVGYLGYLLSNIIFAFFLTWRMGYREWKYYVYAFLLAVAIVVIFKGFLKVHVPGGEIYNYLPETFQRFAKTYL